MLSEQGDHEVEPGLIRKRDVDQSDGILPPSQTRPSLTGSRGRRAVVAGPAEDPGQQLGRQAVVLDDEDGPCVPKTGAIRPGS